jgi:hypothetical protein
MRAVLSLAITFLAAPSLAETCLHSIKPGSEKLTWTGYKYTEKAPVSGTFDKIIFTQKIGGAESMADLINSIEFVVDTNSTNSGNAARDTTLKKTVFGYLKNENTISGKFKNATQLDVIADLVVNDKTQLKLKLDAKDGKLMASGAIDLLKNDLKKSYDSVHLACKGLHTGEDGISKTWSTVDLKIEADYEVKCSKGLMDSIKSWFS